jgi:amino acid transporter
MGFEAACSLSNRIENPERNAPLAVLISFSIVIVLSLLYQFFFYAIIGAQLEAVESKSVFGLFVNTILPQSSLMRTKLIGLMQMGIAISALGGAYGIYFTNSLNLLTLAQKKHIFMPSIFAQLNAQAIPYMCILTEGFLTVLYLAITQGHPVPLRQLSAFGCTITYTLSALALIVALWRKPTSKLLSIIAWLAMCNCLILLMSCINNFRINGIEILYVFTGILIFGTIMYVMTERKKNIA